MVRIPTCQRPEQIFDLLDPQGLLQVTTSLRQSYSILPIPPAIHDHPIHIHVNNIQ